MNKAITPEQLLRLVKKYPDIIPTGRHEGKQVYLCPDCLRPFIFASESSQHNGYRFCHNPNCCNKYLYDDEGNNNGKW